jgi:hypothetical protein
VGGDRLGGRVADVQDFEGDPVDAVEDDEGADEPPAGVE